ncbi:MAG: ankyrin repeat domain-containing protein, partial [Akkermansia sp.]|nr:ankyrin repeat domain-containing protein [Akkermansia sp.]
STANATPDTTPGNTPNVWYRITAPHTATYTAGFRSGCGPAHTCRIFRKEGQELVALPQSPAADNAQGELKFCAEQGDELYVEITALQEGGVFNLYLASDHAVKRLPKFKDLFEMQRMESEYTMPAMLYAILNPDPTDLRELLQLDAEEQLGNDHGRYYLSMAAALGYTEHCRLLLAAGAAVAENEDYYSALSVVLAAGRDETAALLKEAGATADLADDKKIRSLLNDLSENNCLHSLKRLVEHGMPVDTPLRIGKIIRVSKGKKAKSKEDEAPQETHLLHLAAERGRADLVSYLLEQGAAVDALSADAITALEYAAAQGHTECVKLLLAAGASPNATAKDADTSPLSAAAAQGHADCVKLLLEAGADTAATKHKKYSPLMQAIITNNTACIEMLLPATPDLLAATQTGHTTLMAAASMPTPDLLNMLLEHGADANARAISGKTALLLAAQHGRVENMRLLLEHGAQVNTQDNDGDTPLLMTTLHGNTECTKLLLDHGADVTLANKAKYTPLMQAARNGTTECVKLLLQGGAKDSYTRRQRTTSLFAGCLQGGCGLHTFAAGGGL